MAQRRIGQETFRFGATAERQTSLDALAALIDWPRADLVLAPLYPAVKGEKAWPPLAMFKALLLATWYDLSDVALAESLSDRASFRRFCGFSRDEETPERTAFVRFRRALVVHGLDRSLFAAIARDLEAKGACVRKGTSPQSLTAIASLIDATVIGSASKDDKDAAWARHRTRAPAHGYKAHIAADKDSGLIRKVETTPANEADVSIAPAIIPDEPGEVYADRAYDALSVEKAIIAAGGTARLLRKGHRFLPAEALEAHNRPLRPIRSRIEKIFGTWKRSYHFRRMRWLGLAKAKLQVHLAAIAYNVKRSWRMQAA
jgi:transposase, IS5 family